jgi:Mn-dependent DtxR family transcriptional regulator
MPISIDTFESDDLPDGPSVPERVVSFLAANPEQAFTRTEIGTAIDADPDTVSTALSRLHGRDLVRHRGEYWAVTDDEERLHAAYNLHRVQRRLDADDGGIDADAWDATAPDTPHPSETDEEME